jgi:hypothetical protein
LRDVCAAWICAEGQDDGRAHQRARDAPVRGRERVAPMRFSLNDVQLHHRWWGGGGGVGGGGGGGAGLVM